MSLGEDKVIMCDLKKGDVIKFRIPLSPEKAEARMVILSDPVGDRVLVRNISGKKIANCFYIVEMELCEKEFQAHQ